MSEDSQKAYRVLARKYRPQHFDELIGQDALVRTLKNAIESGRIAQAYMLTGVRGVGKTTTARIIAKALNYKGPDGSAGPTTGATDDCKLCAAITEDRHPDVMEMDAASRTGVDDIREILDGVRYAPTEARYKVYIIDEVHMLSKQAFNALLKTLEEPPEHVLFIFATTEIRKVPITVLSRCQRFDLRRIDGVTLTEFYKDIAGRENVEIEEEAARLIAQAADGSVRDGLSLLDQAIALSDGKTIEENQVQDMLGLADRSRILGIIDHGLKGECKEALDILNELYSNGADPVTVLQDMLDFVHLLTRFRVMPEQKDMTGIMAKDTLDQIVSLSSQLSMPALGKAWQILLKGLNELHYAPNPQAAAEMIVIRLAYAADLPDPRDLIQKLQNGDGGGVVAASSGASVSSGGGSAAANEASTMAAPQAALAVAPVPVVAPQKEIDINVTNVSELEVLLRSTGNMILAGQVYQYVYPVKIEPGHIEFRPADDAPSSLSSDLSQVLKMLTGERWVVTVSRETGEPSLAERAQARTSALLEEARSHPVVASVLEMFPGASLNIKEE